MSNPNMKMKPKELIKPKDEVKPLIPPKKSVKEEEEDISSWLGDGLAGQAAKAIKKNQADREKYLDSI
jgi:hypothetical protein